VSCPRTVAGGAEIRPANIPHRHCIGLHMQACQAIHSLSQRSCCIQRHCHRSISFFQPLGLQPFRIVSDFACAYLQ
jgi:hypothetical protein